MRCVAAWPSHCYNKKKSTGVWNGEAILSEIENVVAILNHHCKELERQDGIKFDARNKHDAGSSSPNSINTLTVLLNKTWDHVFVSFKNLHIVSSHNDNYFLLVQIRPKRKSPSKQTDNDKRMYANQDKLRNVLFTLAYYSTIHINDNTVGMSLNKIIDSRLWTKARCRFISSLGFNFKIEVMKYEHLG